MGGGAAAAAKRYCACVLARLAPFNLQQTDDSGLPLK
jgi:hypothetical protein